VVVVVLFGAMTPIGANPMSRLRQVLGLPSRADKKGAPPPQPGTAEEIRAAQAGLRPELLTVIGLVGIAVLILLMEAKPF
jgi:hypothetical protein